MYINLLLRDVKNVNIDNKYRLVALHTSYLQKWMCQLLIYSHKEYFLYKSSCFLLGTVTSSPLLFKLTLSHYFCMRLLYFLCISRFRKI